MNVGLSIILIAYPARAAPDRAHSGESRQAIATYAAIGDTFWPLPGHSLHRPYLARIDEEQARRDPLHR